MRIPFIKTQPVPTSVSANITCEELLDKPWLDPRPEVSSVWTELVEVYRRQFIQRNQKVETINVGSELMIISELIYRAGLTPRSDVLMIFRTVHPNIEITKTNIERFWILTTYSSVREQIHANTAPNFGFSQSAVHQNPQWRAPWTKPQLHGFDAWGRPLTVDPNPMMNPMMVEPITSELIHGLRVRLASMDQRIHALEEIIATQSKDKTSD